MTRILKFVLLILILMLGTPALAATRVKAASGSVMGFNFTCAEAFVTYANAAFDRDNTGLGREGFLLRAVDGAGFLVLDSFTMLDNTSNPMTWAQSFRFEFAPTQNPIRFTNVSISGNGHAEQVVWDLVGECPDLPKAATAPAAPAEFSGPSIPSGYQLRTITCDVAVFDAPQGNPVGTNQIFGGQTWFVDPVPVVAANTEEWSRVFVGGGSPGFIPTSCIGA